MANAAQYIKKTLLPSGLNEILSPSTFRKVAETAPLSINGALTWQRQGKQFATFSLIATILSPLAFTSNRYAKGVAITATVINIGLSFFAKKVVPMGNTGSLEQVSETWNTIKDLNKDKIKELRDKLPPKEKLDGFCDAVASFDFARAFNLIGFDNQNGFGDRLVYGGDIDVREHFNFKISPHSQSIQKRNILFFLIRSATNNGLDFEVFEKLLELEKDSGKNCFARNSFGDSLLSYSSKLQKSQFKLYCLENRLGVDEKELLAIAPELLQNALGDEPLAIAFCDENVVFIEKLLELDFTIIPGKKMEAIYDPPANPIENIINAIKHLLNPEITQPNPNQVCEQEINRLKAILLKIVDRCPESLKIEVPLVEFNDYSTPEKFFETHHPMHLALTVNDDLKIAKELFQRKPAIVFEPFVKGIVDDLEDSEFKTQMLEYWDKGTDEQKKDPEFIVQTYNDEL